MDAKLLDLFWEGFELESHEQLDAQNLCLRLTPKPSQPPFCSGCGQSTPLIHDVNRRRVRERDLFGYRVWLDVPVRRVRCPRCGTRREQIHWLAGRRALTQGMVGYIESLVRLLPIKQVAELLGLHWHTVKDIDYRRLQREVVPADLRWPRARCEWWNKCTVKIHRMIDMWGQLRRVVFRARMEIAFCCKTKCQCFVPRLTCANA